MKQRWQVDGLTHPFRIWQHIIDCHAETPSEAKAIGWRFLMVFCKNDLRKSIVAMRATPISDDIFEEDSELEEALMDRLDDIINGGNAF